MALFSFWVRFGYLINLLTSQNLPKSEGEFFELLKTYFPNVYDVKYLMKSCKNLKGGLQEVANELEVRRVGPQHQAGSDALLTGQTFFRMKEMFFEDDIDDSKYCGHLFGLGTSYVVTPSNANSSPPITTTSTPASSTNTTSSTTLSMSASNAPTAVSTSGGAETTSSTNTESSATSTTTTTSSTNEPNATSGGSSINIGVSS